MALLDRVKARIETDLGDVELQAMIDEVTEEIERRFGPECEITVQLGDLRELESHRRYLPLPRPIDSGQPITVVEIEPGNTGDAENRTTLAADDYRVAHRGRTIERLVDGANGRIYWAPLVEITYTPVSTQASRDEAVIEIVQMAVRHQGVSSERAGDWQATYPDLAARREEILQQLAPRRGLVMA